MASPPAATSPPFASHPPPPSKKRGASGAGLPGGDGTVKRRKPSVMSVPPISAHPLRQTSFPPEDTATARAFSPSYSNHHRSPSADNMSLVSGSQVSGAPSKKKRGRKSKVERAREAAAVAEADTRAGSPSVVGGMRSMSVVSGTSGAPRNKDKDKEKDKAVAGDDDGDAGGDAAANLEILKNMSSQSAARTRKEIEEEEELRAILKQRMSQDQFHRYEQWHRSKIGLAAVRKLINTVTSQSVSQAIPQAMQTVVKLFIGDLVEEARRIQQEWIEAGEKQTDLPDEEEKAEGLSEESQARRHAPLRPDHFIEAYRRWRKTNEGGGSGGSTMWWNQQTRNGADRFAPKAGGRRLFK